MGATRCSPVQWPRLQFQSTPPYGGDSTLVVKGMSKSNFNPRPHAGATSWKAESTGFPYDFNPRPHAGATWFCGYNCMMKWISIHAPMRGRPETRIKKRIQEIISIHAPMRGRLSDNLRERPQAGISIHAPMRGRRRLPCGGHPASYFNPRPHAGATALRASECRPWSNFNPRPHAGATWASVQVGNGKVYFNPRPHAGATSAGVIFSLAITFQSTPPCGGDFNGYDRLLYRITISIHAPMRGRRGDIQTASTALIFQSTPPCGGDADRHQPLRGLLISIHAPMRGRLVSYSAHG